MMSFVTAALAWARGLRKQEPARHGAARLSTPEEVDAAVDGLRRVRLELDEEALDSLECAVDALARIARGEAVAADIATEALLKILGRLPS